MQSGNLTLEGAQGRPLTSNPSSREDSPYSESAKGRLHSESAQGRLHSESAQGRLHPEGAQGRLYSESAQGRLHSEGASDAAHSIASYRAPPQRTQTRTEFGRAPCPTNYHRSQSTNDIIDDARRLSFVLFETPPYSLFFLLNLTPK